MKILSKIWDFALVFLKSKRMKSFYWRSGVMFITALTAALADANIQGTYIVVIGLALGECTKAINNYITENNL